MNITIVSDRLGMDTPHRNALLMGLRELFKNPIMPVAINHVTPHSFGGDSSAVVFVSGVSLNRQARVERLIEVALEGGKYIAFHHTS